MDFDDIAARRQTANFAEQLQITLLYIHEGIPNLFNAIPRMDESLANLLELSLNLLIDVDFEYRLAASPQEILAFIPDAEQSDEDTLSLWYRTLTRYRDALSRYHAFYFDKLNSRLAQGRTGGSQLLRTTLRVIQRVMRLIELAKPLLWSII